MANPTRTSLTVALPDALVAKTSLDPLLEVLHGEVVPVEKITPNPARYFVIVRQLGIKEKIGSIFVPDAAKDAQSWTHGLGVVLKVGPSAYRGRKMEDLGLGEADRPQRGDIIQFQARGVPTRFKVKDIELLALPDDAYYATVEPDQVPYVSFAL